ncbi:hypothetical protein [Streptomyces avermitilis]|uniref:hypothetical protein n=1 Tax=Streptomyces avermitilis TaxID=33903 RepID=UPI0033A624BF
MADDLARGRIGGPILSSEGKGHGMSDDLQAKPPAYDRAVHAADASNPGLSQDER